MLEFDPQSPPASGQVVKNADIVRSSLSTVKPDVASVNWVSPSSINLKGDAKIVLIQLKDFHTGKLAENSQLPSEELQVVKINVRPKQLQQLVLIDKLVKEAGVKELYAENMSQEVINYFDSTFKYLRNPNVKEMLDVIKKETKQTTVSGVEKYIKENPKARITVLLNSSSSWRTLLKIEEDMSRSSALRAAFDGKVRLLSPEDAKLHREVFDYVTRNPLSSMGKTGDPKLNVLQDKRDAYAVKAIAAKANPVSLFVQGAGHDLRKEVADHNKNNPNNQIALVEVTPKAVANVMAVLDK